MGYTCLFVDDVEMCNCNLTRGRHVIGGGTGELPPQRNEYFGTWLYSLLMGLKLYCGYFICYLVGNFIVHTQPLL